MHICPFNTNRVLLIARPGVRIPLLTAFMLLAMLPDNVTAQWSTLTGPEKRWAVFHPFAALKVRRINDQCAHFYDRKVLAGRLDSFPAGGKLDAFRHVFYMAALAQQIRLRKVRKLGEAHEKGNHRQFKKQQLEEGERPDSLSTVMDLHNNELGIKIGCNQSSLPLQQLRDLAIQKIIAGEALIMKRTASGEYLDCTGNVIDLSKYAGLWHVPKCLVPSSLRYKP